jgi:hypothetical protein
MIRHFFSLLVLASIAGAAERKLEINDGDRVLLIGDVLVERENNYGYIESKMRREFAGKRFAVRNLGYSGDSPLGASRASFDPVEKGVDALKEQLAVVKPTVAILGYGMAASLDDLTYRKNDPVLNPDPVRYGVEHSPAKFRTELLALMDLITAASPEGKVRFVFVGPIKHEDLRATRPGLPDPAEHNALLAEYEQVMEQLAAEKQSPFVQGEWQKAAGIDLAQGTDNGIHLNPRGLQALSESFAASSAGKRMRPSGMLRLRNSAPCGRRSCARTRSSFIAVVRRTTPTSSASANRSRGAMRWRFRSLILSSKKPRQT